MLHRCTEYYWSTDASDDDRVTWARRIAWPRSQSLACVYFVQSPLVPPPYVCRVSNLQAPVGSYYYRRQETEITCAWHPGPDRRRRREETGRQFSFVGAQDRSRRINQFSPRLPAKRQKSQAMLRCINFNSGLPPASP